MGLRRARLVRSAFAAINLVAALTSLGVGTLILLTHERPAPPPPPPRPISLPDGHSLDFEPTMPELRPAKTTPEPVRPSALEDFRILFDASQDFESRYRVIFALLETEPEKRVCILARRGMDEDQVMLVPGERVGTWLLLGIDAGTETPRSVRLRFRDLRRGEDVVTIFAPFL